MQAATRNGVSVQALLRCNSLAQEGSGKVCHQGASSQCVEGNVQGRNCSRRHKLPGEGHDAVSGVHQAPWAAKNEKNQVCRRESAKEASHVRQMQADGPQQKDVPAAPGLLVEQVISNDKRIKSRNGFSLVSSGKGAEMQKQKFRGGFLSF